MIEIILLLLFALVVFGGGGYYYYTKVYNKKAATTTPGDVITIGDDGVTKSSGSTTETYLEMPLTAYCSQPSRPNWCNLTPTSEMQYVYDPVGGGTTDVGGFTTTFDNNTGLCSDGTRDCIYTEVYDSTRTLKDIVNEKGEHMVEKFVDDLWSDKLQFSDTSKELFKKTIMIEDGKFYMIMEDGTKLQIVPGGKFGPTTDGKIIFPPGMIILYVSLYYKFNNIKKPFFEFEVKSHKPVGETLLATST